MNLRRRGVLTCTDCDFCGWAAEDACHLFRDCWMAKAVGKTLNIPDRIFEARGGAPCDWLWWCALELSAASFRTLLCASWTIWGCRNAIRHNKPIWKVEEMGARVQSLIMQFDTYALANSPRPSQNFSDSRSVFCDGSWTSPGAHAGLAAIFINEDGVQSISAKCVDRIRSPRDAEGEAILLGLNLALSLHLVSVTIISDSIEVVDAIFKGMIVGSPQPKWLPACCKILADRRGWSVQHCFRENNRYADSVARFARMSNWSWCVLNALPRIEAVRDLLRQE